MTPAAVTYFLARLAVCAVIVLAAVCAALQRRVRALEDFDELEMIAREELGAEVVRLKRKIERPWECDDGDEAAA